MIRMSHISRVMYLNIFQRKHNYGHALLIVMSKFKLHDMHFDIRCLVLHAHLHIISSVVSIRLALHVPRSLEMRLQSDQMSKDVTM